jgi:hypothetical protein
MVNRKPGALAHAGSMRLLTAALLAFFEAKKSSGWLAAAGAALAFSMVVRHESGAVCGRVPVFAQGSKSKIVAICASRCSGLCVFFVAWSYSGEPVAPYYLPQLPGGNSLALGPHFFEALAGNLISPGRGPFVYVPVFLLAVPSLLRKPTGCVFSRLRPFLAGTLAAHWILISTFEDWWAGFSFGPRDFRRDSAVRALFNTRFAAAQFQAKACPVLRAGCRQFLRSTIVEPTA